MKLDTLIKNLTKKHVIFSCRKNQYNTSLDMVLVQCKNGSIIEYTFLNKILVTIN